MVRRNDYIFGVVAVLVLYASCLLAEWRGDIILFVVLHGLIWQLLFIWVNGKQKQRTGKDISWIVFGLLAASAVISPFIAVPLLYGLPVYRLLRISGDSVRRKSSRGQCVRATGGGDDTFPYVRGAGTGMMAGLVAHNIAASGAEDYPDDFPVSSPALTSEPYQYEDFPFEDININPATGLPMSGCVDIAGNIYGASSMDNDHGHHNDSYDYNHDHYYDSEYN